MIYAAGGVSINVSKLPGGKLCDYFDFTTKHFNEYKEMFKDVSSEILERGINFDEYYLAKCLPPDDNVHVVPMIHISRGKLRYRWYEYASLSTVSNWKDCPLLDWVNEQSLIDTQITINRQIAKHCHPTRNPLLSFLC